MRYFSMMLHAVESCLMNSGSRNTATDLFELDCSKSPNEGLSKSILPVL